MTVSGSHAGGILIVGDSTVDWFIAEPASGRPDTLEARYVWTLTDGPGLSHIAGGAALDYDVLAATAALAASPLPVAGPVIPDDLQGNPSSSSITRTFSSWSPQPRTTGAKQLVWRMDRFIGLHPASDLPAELEVRDGEILPACILIEDGNQIVPPAARSLAGANLWYGCSNRCSPDRCARWRRAL